MKYRSNEEINTVQIAGQHINKFQNIVLFGTGEMGKLIIKDLHRQHKKVIYAIDNDPQKWGKRIKGVKILKPEQGVKISRERATSYIVANAQHSADMFRQLCEMGINEEQIIICDNIGKIKKEIIIGGPHKNENKHFYFDMPKGRLPADFFFSIYNIIRVVYYETLRRLLHPSGKCYKRYKVSICAIFRDEAMYLKEWIEYHRIIGIEHFYMYNNFSEDDYKSVLEPYVLNGEVDLINWPYPQGQISAYKNCIERFSGESQWIGFIDLDEFVVPIDNDNIYSFLKKFERNCGAVLIYWKMFGTSGLLERDESGLVTENFTVSWKKHFDIGKCFINTNYECKFNEKNLTVHHRAWMTYRGIAFPPVNVFGRVSLDMRSNDFTFGHNSFPVQINHYYIKSYNEGLKKERNQMYIFKRTLGII